ncbi:ATP-binding protein [Streptomyces sp. B6B3]|uniref:ATP-binding protein n=1 Tax=Streptomyces sp. B6B3 TaxID=3153570 RepID=UPI00325D1C62
MQIPAVVVACLSAGCAVALLLAVLWPRQHRRVTDARRQADAARVETRTLRGQLAEAGRRERMMVEEVGHLTTTRLPALAKALRHPHVRVPEPLHPPLAETSGGQALEAVLSEVSRAVVGERRRVDGAAQAAMRGATTKLQTMCYQVQTTVDELLHKYDDPELAERLAGLDYLNEQILRRLQVTRVVCGAGAGLVRTKSPLRALVTGASSRIPSYERVQIVDHLPEPIAVADRAAEPVAIMVAELLANAVHHSHGTLPVEVSLHQAHNGAVVVINDAGIGMNAEEFTKARKLLAGTGETFLAELGDPPSSGFAAIGQLCRQYGVSVSVEPSHYAGVKAVVFVPSELLTAVSEEDQPPIPAPLSRPMPPPAMPPPTEQLPVPAPPVVSTRPATPANPVAPTTQPVPPGPPAPPAPRTGAGDPTVAPPGGVPGGVPPLPQRRNRRTGPSPEQLPPERGQAEYLRDPQEAAARMGALQRGTAQGRAAGVSGPGFRASDGPASEDESERDNR